MDAGGSLRSPLGLRGRASSMEESRESMACVFVDFCDV